VSEQPKPAHGLAGLLAAGFVNSKLTPLIIIASLLVGLGALLGLPREEEPQIKVPMVDVMVSLPGFSAKEVEERATVPMEKLLWEIPGVEYLYSTSRPGEAMIITRFKVGEDPEASLVKLSEKLRANFDRIPPGVSPPLIKPRSIDDVPILALTFHGGGHDHATLRRIAAQVDETVKQVPLVAQTTLIGGARRELRVLLDPAQLAARNLTPAGILPMLRQSNRQYRAGTLVSADQSIVVETGAFLATAREVGDVVVGVHQGRPVYLREVAAIEDGTAESSQYVFHSTGPASGQPPVEEPAVTLTVAKRPGANAITVAEEVLRKVETLKGRILPSTLEVSITRHYGETAAEKSNELLLHMGIAVAGRGPPDLAHAGLARVGRSWRWPSRPRSRSRSLVFYLYGFTLNRITLFALIFSIGILVDDAIVVVENIVRHYHLPENRGRRWSGHRGGGGREVGNPTILATFAVIAAVLPMAFVGGLMGPYMRPIPVGASAAMFWSLLIAFIVTPWASVRILGSAAPVPLTADGAVDGHHATSDTKAPRPLFTRPTAASWFRCSADAVARWAFLHRHHRPAPARHGDSWDGLGEGEDAALRQQERVPGDPEHARGQFPRTHRPGGARDGGRAVRRARGDVDYQVYVGTAAPFNFNGLVRHYFLRAGQRTWPTSR
jgi:multidrug efflux pump subunit AcrB